MTIKSGFFNSLNHDRMYDADDMNAIFDGIITDGVFGNIGNRFIVTPGSGMTINIGTGKARLHQIFVENDANMVLQVSQSDVLLNRIDVVVIRVDKTISGRRGDITILKGTPSQNPIAPTLSTDSQIWEMPIAYINVNANASKIDSSDIRYLVGRNSTPLITAPMQTVNVESYVSNMEAQFSDWFSDVKGKLSTDAAGNLQNQINTLKPKVDTVNSALTFNGQNTTTKGSLEVTGKLSAKGGLVISDDTFLVKRLNGVGVRPTLNAVMGDKEDVRITVTSPDGYKAIGVIQAYSDFRASVSLYNFVNNVAYCSVFNSSGWAGVSTVISIDVLYVRCK